jgi:hypothetical protein
MFGAKTTGLGQVEQLLNLCFFGSASSPRLHSIKDIKAHVRHSIKQGRGSIPAFRTKFNADAIPTPG